MRGPTRRARRAGLLSLAAVCAVLLAGLSLRSGPGPRPGGADAELRWLEERSMLRQAERSARGVSGRGV